MVPWEWAKGTYFKEGTTGLAHRSGARAFRSGPSRLQGLCRLAALAQPPSGFWSGGEARVWETAWEPGRS